jgi:U32 family peptidase
MAMNKRTELMSPAGDWPQLNAAIEAGADAVYFGLPHFSARAKVGFQLAELPTIMDHLHRRGVKGYITFNTLVFDSEIAIAEQAIMELAAANVDALIVQDVGIARLIRDIAPELTIHGSTQMSITSAEGAELAAELGCSRVVLARELELADIRRIAAQTSVELETFIHGALCVSYSGQCFSSEAWGGRSANRGQCAQACRLDYELVVDGKTRELGANRYLLSPGDLMALDYIPQLVDAGISCLKIEGRYKNAEYVWLTTRAYRQALDDAFANRPLSVTESDRQDLEQIYSRGLGPYFISGINHQQVVDGRAPRHRGVFLGKVTQVQRESVIVEGTQAIYRGDGLVFDAADRRTIDGVEPGGFVYDVSEVGTNQRLVTLGRQESLQRQVQPGDWVWRTLDPRLEKRLRSQLEKEQPTRTDPLNFDLDLRVGEPLKITASIPQGISVTHHSTELLAEAERKGATVDSLREQLDRLGGTPFHLGEMTASIAGSVFVPASLLNRLRREVVEKIERARIARPTLQTRMVAEKKLKEVSERFSIAPLSANESTPQIHLLVRTPEQLAGAIAARPDSITLDYLELYGLRTSVVQVQAAGIRCRVASPRVLKPSEQKVTRFLLSLEVDILVRSGGLLHDLRKRPQNGDHHSEEIRLDGDFSLNAANALSCATYLDLGLNRIAPTYDLNAKQIVDLAARIEPRRLEVVVLQHLPIFHMEHCVFCRFLSTGTDSSNCGHPCEKHRLAVRDSSGREHPVMADVGCRNTVFNSEMQSAADFLDDLRGAGICNFRLEFVHQTADDVMKSTEAFKNFLQGRSSTSQLAAVWNEINRFGTTQGSFFVPRTDKGPLIQLGRSS